VKKKHNDISSKKLGKFLKKRKKSKKTKKTKKYKKQNGARSGFVSSPFISR
jgi:hypothetical protein